MIRDAVDVGPRPSSLRAAWYQLGGTACDSGVTVLADNNVAWATRWDLLSSAEDSIEASYFTIDDDVFGLAFLGRLLERAEAGVRVRLLVDARGSQDLTFNAADHLQELVHSGVDVQIFNPPLPQVLRALLEASPTLLVCGTHNKILVVDDAVAVTGGRNIGTVYFSSALEHPEAFVDADVLLDGAEAVQAVAAVMHEELGAPANERVAPDWINLVSRRAELLLIAAAMDAWMAGTIAPGPVDVVADALALAALSGVGEDIDAAAVAAARPRLVELAGLRSLCATVPVWEGERFHVETRVVAAAARILRRDHSVTDALVRAIAGARERIVLESPYFVPSLRLVRALEDAASRGVKITLMTNSPLSSDNAASQALFIDSWPEIMVRVPTLRVFAGATPQTLHAKRAVFDGQLTFVGTYNIDPFSAHVNSEMVVAVWSERFAAATSSEQARRLVDGTMVEYLVERDPAGAPRRVPFGRPNSGHVRVLFGPDQHTPPDDLERLRALKTFLLGQQLLWDFEVLAW
ncbi:MAG: phosphatidylserine/phosphatidylglycerophosphate/cardiolipin synthase family protein [Deltaproteobacteria bacterium]|nr:phosphatidylserine/phosphatidylglycerophosphate/cardiolipin synthase family protein [Deltaproteobacteria bacterium]